MSDVTEYEQDLQVCRFNKHNIYNVQITIFNNV